MNLLKLFAITLTLVGLGQVNAATLSELKNKYDSSHMPNVKTIFGWYSGQCVSLREPNKEKGSLLVVADEYNEATDSWGLKLILPLGSIVQEPNYYDNMDDEKAQNAADNIWPENMEFAYEKNDSLKNILVYDVPTVPSGLISLRQEATHLYLKFSNLEEDGDYFYCDYSKQVAVGVESNK